MRRCSADVFVVRRQARGAAAPAPPALTACVLRSIAAQAEIRIALTPPADRQSRSWPELFFVRLEPAAKSPMRDGLSRDLGAGRCRFFCPCLAPSTCPGPRSRFSVRTGPRILARVRFWPWSSRPDLNKPASKFFGLLRGRIRYRKSPHWRGPKQSVYRFLRLAIPVIRPSTLLMSQTFSRRTCDRPRDYRIIRSPPKAKSVARAPASPARRTLASR